VAVAVADPVGVGLAGGALGVLQGLEEGAGVARGGALVDGGGGLVHEVVEGFDSVGDGGRVDHAHGADVVALPGLDRADRVAARADDQQRGGRGGQKGGGGGVHCSASTFQPMVALVVGVASTLIVNWVAVTPDTQQRVTPADAALRVSVICAIDGVTASA